MNKFLKIVLGSMTACAALFVSCGSDKDEPATPAASITADPASLSFGYDASEATFSVTTSGEWNASTDNDWISLTCTGTATTSGSVTVRVKANPSLEARTGTITLYSGRATATVAVSQAGMPLPDPDPDIEVPEGYTLVWHDEFNSGTTLNTDDWTHQAASPGWVNNELQTYVKGEYGGQRVTEIKDGHLSITAFKSGSSVYSGRVYAKESTGWKYGIIEASIRLPKGKGTWPAFWMMPVNNDFGTNPWPRCGEIDIMEEVGYNPNYTSSSLHTQAYNHTKGTQKTAERLTEGAQDNYHVYRLEWTEDYIRTYVDGRLLLSFNNDKTGNVDTWPFDKPFYVILNLAWGGDWGGAQGVDESALPATMDVDYVRVFQKL